MRRFRLPMLAVLACAAFAAPPAHAATSRCVEPGADWPRQSPAAAGMDAVKLQEAMDYGSANAGFAVRVYRRGCLVAEDRSANARRDEKFESYSMAKSVTAMMFGRAMELGLIDPEDPVGSLVPEADRPHGWITMRDLLTMTSGLRWNGFRDYNVFTMPDRVRDALTLEMVRPRGTYFEYAQSAVALLAEAIGRSAGMDAGKFVQDELMTPLGIKAGTWSWTRDKAGHIMGFYGVNMRADDFGRLGELMRRNGVWRGRRLLDPYFMQEAIRPTETNGCYGWLIWLNAAKPCVGPRITERPVDDAREFPDLPADLYHFSGLFGQLVAVFPSQDLVIVRTGQDRSLAFSGSEDWEYGLYKRVLGSITDQRIVPPGPAPKTGPNDNPDADSGFQNALAEPDQYSQGSDPPPLPPAGPARARALRPRLAKPRVSRRGTVSIRLTCPIRWPAKLAPACIGIARMQGVRRSKRYSIRAGWAKTVKLRLTARRLRRLRRVKRMTLLLSATNRDAVEGTRVRIPVTIQRPPAKKKRRR